MRAREGEGRLTGFLSALHGQIVNHDTNVPVGPLDDHFGLACDTGSVVRISDPSTAVTEIPSRTECCQTGVDSCDDTLSSSFLVPCRPIDLTGQEETLYTNFVRQYPRVKVTAS